VGKSQLGKSTYITE